jgi:hypothetical protein
MPRSCTICTHRERPAIDEALVAGEPFRNIAERFGTSLAALVRHKTDHLPPHLAKAKEAKEVAQADSLTAELKRIMARVTLLFDACDRWLRDPENPEQYDIGPRAEDVSVTYLEPIGEDKVLRRKARLSALLPKIESQGLTVERVELKHADPRDLILKTAQRLEGQLELLARLLGELKDTATVNVLVLPEWHALRALVLEALGPYPQARIAVAEALGRVNSNGHGA